MQDRDTYRIADGRRGLSRRAAPPHPASWLADPLRRHEIRYWDGWRWTDHVSDGGIPATDPVRGGSGLPVPRRIVPTAAGDRLIPPGPPPGRSRTLWPWLVAAAAAILLAVIVTGTAGTNEPAGTPVRIVRRASTPTTTAMTLPVSECQRIVLEVRAGLRTMTEARYRRVCGALPAGVDLGPTTTATAGGFEAARRP